MAQRRRVGCCRSCWSSLGDVWLAGQRRRRTRLEPFGDEFAEAQTRSPSCASSPCQSGRDAGPAAPARGNRPRRAHPPDHLDVVRLVAKVIDPAVGDAAQLLMAECSGTPSPRRRRASRCQIRERDPSVHVVESDHHEPASREPPRRRSRIVRRLRSLARTPSMSDSNPQRAEGAV